MRQNVSIKLQQKFFLKKGEYICEKNILENAYKSKLEDFVDRYCEKMNM
ncbi:hypothetical protein RR47_GL000854 [Enterococcus columbae DSM 7374 = ATCC 51263]|nr:hypothetical protein RR47_GL000854 [Enterococcus columbae DSM 7374 = ATCC 51263]